MTLTEIRDDGRKLPPVGTCHGCGKKVTGERRYCGPCAAKVDDRKLPRIPAVCDECGWEGKPRQRKDQARMAVRMHQLGPVCPASPNYVPPAERDARRKARQSAAARRRNAVDAGQGCTIDTGECSCAACTLAAKDKASPLDLGGQWVKRGNVRVWVA